MRLKIIAGNLVAVLLVGLGSFFFVKTDIEAELGARLDAEISTNGEVLADAWRLMAAEFEGQVRNRAAQPELRLAYGALDLNSRRQRIHSVANSISSWFEDPSRNHGGRPDVVLLTDETGRVIARDQDINRLNDFNLVRPLPTVRRVLGGESVHDSWFREDEGKLFQVAMAPVRSEEGSVIGAVLVGYDISNGVARRLGAKVGRDVAFVRGGEVYSSSLSTSAADGFRGQLRGPLQAAATAAQGGAVSANFQVTLAGDSFIGALRPLPLAASEPAAFAVLGNRTEAIAPAKVSNFILALMGLGILIVCVYGFVMGSGFLKPLEIIEEGVLQIINGRTDLRIDVESPEFGGLAYRINQLVNVFTGTEETDEEGRSSAPAGWAGPAEGGGGAAAGASGGDEDDEDPELAAKLAAEPEDAYHARVYREYVAAKQAAGEDVSNIPEDRFLARLQKNAASLVTKHGCRMVRFEVQTKGDQVILKPVIIR